jgi:hypothetical protein
MCACAKVDNIGRRDVSVLFVGAEATPPAAAAVAARGVAFAPKIPGGIRYARISARTGVCYVLYILHHCTN